MANNIADGTKVLTNNGIGTILYRRGDWYGVRLDGEDRSDEYPVEAVTAAE